jgi:hypothetical protein
LMLFVIFWFRLASEVVRSLALISVEASLARLEYL